MIGQCTLAHMSHWEEVNNVRIIATLADRLLGLMVPTVTAGACCPHDPWVQECSCHESTETVWAKNCQYNCACQPVCGACYNTYIGC